MGKFYLHDGNNNLISEGSCPDGDEHLQIRVGTILGMGDVPHNIGYPPEPEPSVENKRKMAYPPIGEQLDMLWHAMDEGTITKVPDFYDSIKAVKDSIPKE